MVLIRCKEDFPDIYLPVLLNLMLGTRVSETLVLKYQDIDFISKTVYISKQIGYQWDKKTLTLQKSEIETKTENGNRFVPLPDWVAEEIIVKRTWYEDMRERVPGFQDLDYICCRHDMRHVYATMLKNNSLNVKAISKFLGHARPEFTEDVYITQTEVTIPKENQ